MGRSRQERNQPQAPTPPLRKKPTPRPANKEGRQDKDGTRREQEPRTPPLSLLPHQFIRGSPAALLVVRDWRSVILLFVAKKSARVRAQMKDPGFDNGSSACERVVCLSSKGSRGQGSRPESMLHIRRASGPANEGLVGLPLHLAGNTLRKRSMMAGTQRPHRLTPRKEQKRRGSSRRKEHETLNRLSPAPG